MSKAGQKRLNALYKNEKGFTLVELIVVLVILAILAAILIPQLLGNVGKFTYFSVLGYYDRRTAQRSAYICDS